MIVYPEATAALIEARQRLRDYVRARQMTRHTFLVKIVHVALHHRHAPGDDAPTQDDIVLYSLAADCVFALCAYKPPKGFGSLNSAVIDLHQEKHIAAFSADLPGLSASAVLSAFDPHARLAHPEAAQIESSLLRLSVSPDFLEGVLSGKQRSYVDTVDFLRELFLESACESIGSFLIVPLEDLDDILRELRNVPGCSRVYVLGFASGVIKVGVSGSLSSRISTLQAQHGALTHVAFTEHSTTSVATAFEGSCHAALSEYLIPKTTEFFSGLSFADAVRMLPEYAPPFYTPSPAASSRISDFAKSIMLSGNNDTCWRLPVADAVRCAKALLTAYTARA